VESALWEAVEQGDPRDEVSIIARLLPGAAPPPGLRIIARFGLIVTGRVRRGEIPAVRSAVPSAKLPQAYTPAPYEDAGDEADDLAPRASDIRRAEMLPTGRGVVLAHLDWGLDFAHPAFRRPDGSTRLLALWDQGCAYDPAHPNRYGFGRIFRRAEIDAALAAPDPYAALGYRWWTSDRGSGSHGTHTLGISGGSPCPGLPAGMAPEADLVFVDLSTRTERGRQPLGSSTDLLEGWDLCNRIAGPRPLVGNASLGRQAGQKDGLTLTEQALDWSVASRPGRALAMSCGNYFAKGAHAQLTLLPGETRHLHLEFGPGARKAELDLWYPRADRLDVAVEGPDGIAAGPVEPDRRADLLYGGETVGRLYHRTDDPNNGDNQVSLYLYPAAPTGEWRLSLSGRSVGDGRVHAWVERDPEGPARLRFAAGDDDPRSSLGTICTGFSTLAVAAYDAHSPGREPGRFSSAGPTRDGRDSRPTLAAPGCKVLSARSRPRTGADAPLATRMSGTSMAAPHVAGTMALMFAAAPRPLWIDEVRALLVETADPVLPEQRTRLGAGYLDTSAAVGAASALSPVAAAGRVPAPPRAPRPLVRLPSTQESEMAEFEEYEGFEEAPFDCDADYDAELEGGGESGLDAVDAEALFATVEAEGEADGEGREDAKGARRRRGPGRAPFQAHEPVGGGGGRRLVVPRRGRASPIALSVPLGGAPAPAPSPPPGAPSAPAAAPAPTVAVPPVGSPDDPPLPADPGEPAEPIAAGAEFADEGAADSAEATWRRRRAAPLPFQIQIPVGGGGGLGLAVPIGGRGSPLALSVPLGGGAPAPAAPPAAPAAPAPAVAAGVAPADPPLFADPGEPVEAISAAAQYAADQGEIEAETCEACGPDCRCDRAAEDEAALAEAAEMDALERGYARTDYSDVDARYAGEQLMAAVGAAIETVPGDGEGEFLDALAESLGDAEGTAESTSERPSLYALFQAAVAGQARPQRLFGRAIRVIARPGDPLGRVRPLRGDLLLRALPGERRVYLAVVAGATACAFERLAERGLRAEGGDAALPGRYLHVVEAWPVRRAEAEGFARRVANAADLIPLDTVIVRLAPPGAEAGEPGDAEDEPGDPSEPNLAVGARGSAVAALQQRLNALHARRTAAGLAGLGNMPLAEDGVFGPRLRAAVAAMQRLAPAGLVPVPDGEMDRAAWSALALLEAAAARLPAAPSAPAAPPVASRAAGAVQAGQEIVEHLPLLARHAGTPPDLVLRWNEMATAPEQVDVVIHLHGFSGLGQAMRIDRHKLPESGLDFVNPDNPAQIGRLAPTLAILPRGNFYGGRSHMGYDFPALFAPGALARLIALGLERFATAAGLPRVQRGRLILTAHSGGGAALMRLLAEADPDEIHCFDALYNPPRPLIRWLEAKLSGAGAGAAAMRVLYRAGEGTAVHSREVAQALAAAATAHPDVQRRFRVEATAEPHNGIPRRYGWSLLADAAADVDLARRHAGAGQSAPPGYRRAGGEAEWGENEPADAGLAQPEVDALARCEFGNATELEAWFASSGGFADWFNRTLSGHAPFVRPGRGGVLRVPTGAGARARFRGFWDALEVAYGRPRVSLLEFAALMAIVLNETDGDFAGRTESSGRGGGGRTDARGPHRGLAYFFDRIELRPGHWKASYNHLDGGLTAGQLFNDDAYVAAHGHLGGADRLARRGNDYGGAWNGDVYPATEFSTDEHAAETAFVREADFYKFRGRGIIQTTGRGSYLHLVRHIRTYRGTDPTLNALKVRWSAVSDETACTVSTNDEWERLFAVPEMLGVAFALHSGGPHGYRIMSRRAEVLNAVPAPHQRGAQGSIFLMGRAISGSPAYGAGLYRDRVLALLRAMLPLAASGPAPVTHGSAPVSPDGETEHAHHGPSRTTAVAVPDEATLREQWQANPRAHGYFRNSEARYLEYAPLFAHRGVADAAAYMAENMTTLTFFGARNPGHRGLAAPLRAAEEALSGHVIDPPLHPFGCLNIRRIAGTNRLSFHALGRAIDLNPGTNPHIRDPRAFEVIRAVTGVDLPHERSPRRLREASAQFQADFNDAWIAGQGDAHLRALLADPTLLRLLRSYGAHGFCNLDERLIEALVAAGLNWGGTWTTSKDFMHFELR